MRLQGLLVKTKEKRIDKRKKKERYREEKEQRKERERKKKERKRKNRRKMAGLLLSYKNPMYIFAE